MKYFSCIRISCKTGNNLWVAPLFRCRHLKVLRIVVHLSTLNKVMNCSHTSVLCRFILNLMTESGATVEQKVPHKRFFSDDGKSWKLHLHLNILDYWIKKSDLKQQDLVQTQLYRVFPLLITLSAPIDPLACILCDPPGNQLSSSSVSFT